MSRGAEFWEGFASSYSPFQQGDAPRLIIDRLFGLGILAHDMDVLEVGSGTGAYSLELAPRVRSLTCIDASPSMHGILEGNARRMGIDNISTVTVEWPADVPADSFDNCIMPLCPGSSTPESLERAESCARVSVASVNWVVNHHDDLEMAVWDELGLERPCLDRGSTAVQEWAAENGREPVVEEFRIHVEAEMPVSAKVSAMQRMFSAQGVDSDVSGIVESLIASEDGVYRYSADNVLRLVCWLI